MSAALKRSLLTASTFRSAASATTIKTISRGFRTSAFRMGVHNVNSEHEQHADLSNSKAEFDAVLKDHKVVVMDAFATWCGPCKQIAPVVVKFSDEYPDAYFIKLDVDEVPDVAQELAIRAMPTFILFKDGEKVREVVGANPQALKAAIADSVGAGS